MTKQLFLLALLFVVLLPFVMKAAGRSPFIVDRAGVLSHRTKRQIDHALLDLYSQEGTKIIMVLIKPLSGRPINDQVAEIVERRKLGTSGRWVLVVASPRDQKVQIQLSQGLKDVLSEKIQQAVAAAMQSQFHASLPNQATLNGLVQIVRRTNPDFPIHSYFSNGRHAAYASVSEFVFFIVATMVFLFVGRRGFWRFLFKNDETETFSDAFDAHRASGDW